MEWIYDGQTGRVFDAALRERLTSANHSAEQWIAARRKPGRRPGLYASIAPLIAACALLFVGYADAGHVWKRIGGLAIDNEQLEAARVACKGKVAVLGNLAAMAPESFDQASRAIFDGCMADRGYLR